MKTMIMMAGLAFLLGTTTLVAAGEHSCCTTSSETSTTTKGSEKTDIQLACNPAIENWLNGAGKTCPMRGSGAGITTITSTREVTVCHDKNEYPR